MRAYDLVEQGYTLWFGMPPSKLYTSWAKDFPDKVDVVLDGGVRDSGNPFAFNWVWRSRGKAGVKTSSSIIAWRPHDSGNDKSANEGVGIARAGSCSSDEVNHPTHYTNGNIECIDIIREMVRGKSEMEAACIANVVKYLYRYKDKGGIKSVEKAQWYLNLMIEEMKNEK